MDDFAFETKIREVVFDLSKPLVNRRNTIYNILSWRMLKVIRPIIIKFWQFKITNSLNKWVTIKPSFWS